MNAQEFTKAMSFLGIAYNKEFTEEQVKVWFSFFQEERFENFTKAISRIISKSKFLPPIAEVKVELSTMKNPVLELSAVEEWSKVERAISRHGYYNPEEAEMDLNPLTWEVIRLMGGWRSICMSEEGHWLTKRFIDLFEERQQSESNLARLALPQMTDREARKILETVQFKQLGEGTN